MKLSLVLFLLFLFTGCSIHRQVGHHVIFEIEGHLRFERNIEIDSNRTNHIEWPILNGVITNQTQRPNLP